jgi:acetylornithine/N-succinyldiaminopimelate aminotransferase
MGLAMENSQLAGLYRDHVIPTYGRFDLDLESGSGCRVTDADGRTYLDFGAGIAVCSLGHAHPDVTAAIADQAARLVHASNLYRTRPQAELAQRINAFTGPGKVFFCNSGAEANEGLIKLARKVGSPNGRFGILAFEGSFHGRTMAGISATGQQKIKNGFEPLVEGFRHARFNDLASVHASIGPETGAILVEPVQGEGGIHVADADFLRGLRALCDERGLLLFFDEVQCGLGRTGDWCGWRTIAPGVEPDGVSWAKGIANGFPLGAFWAGRRDIKGTPLCDVLGPGSHGTTYGGNPVACAAGLAVLEVIERENLLTHAREMGSLLTDLLREHLPQGAIVRGIGLMLGLVLPDPLTARDFVITLQKNGLLAIPAGERVVRFLPPLTVSAAEIQEAVSLVERSFQTYHAYVP